MPPVAIFNTHKNKEKETRLVISSLNRDERTCVDVSLSVEEVKRLAEYVTNFLDKEMYAKERKGKGKASAEGKTA